MHYWFKHISFLWYYLLSTFYLIFLPSISHYPLAYFGPFLIVTIYRLPLLGSVWCAFIAALTFCFITHQNALLPTITCYLLSTYFIFRMQHLLFNDALFTYPLMNFIFSIFLGFFQYLFILLSKTMIDESFLIVIFEIFKYAIANALYSFLGFVIPIAIYRYWKPKPSKKRSSRRYI